MLIQIRRGTFETNSSSTHSLVMCSGQEWDKFMKGELVFDADSDTFIPEIMIDDDYDEEDDGKRYYTYKEMFEDGDFDYETITEEYTTKSGDKVVGISYYGYN